MTQAWLDNASLNKPDEPYRYGEDIEWDDENRYGWVSVDPCTPNAYEAYWDWEEEEWIAL